MTCKFKDCTRGPRCKGYCEAHYRQRLKRRKLVPLRKFVVLACRVPGCGREQQAKRLCTAHYQRSLRGVQLDTPVTYRGGGRVAEDEGMHANTPARVEREIAEGVRCKCGLLKPCNACAPTIRDIAGKGLGCWV